MKDRDLKDLTESTTTMGKKLKRKAESTTNSEVKKQEKKHVQEAKKIKPTHLELKGIEMAVAGIYKQLIELYKDNPNNVNDIFKIPAIDPTLSLEQFVTKLCQASMSPECKESIIVTSFIYIDKFINQNTQFKITEDNIRPLIITSLLTASKFLIDGSQQNLLFAEVAHHIGASEISLKAINKCEIEFLAKINFDLYISNETFKDYVTRFREELQSINQTSSPTPATVKLTPSRE